MKTTMIIRSLAVILLTTLSVPAMASVPAASDPTGIWTGSGNFEENCPPTPGPAGTFTESADLTINVFNYNSSTGDFDVTVTAKLDDPGDPETISYSGSGYFFTPGSFNVSFSGTNEDGGFESWMGTGVASGTNEVTFTSLSGTESGGFNCTFTMLGNIVVKRDASIIIDSAEAPSNAVTSNAQTLATSVTTTTGFLGTRIQGALSGNQNAGFSRAGRGYMLEAPASGLAAGDTFNNLGLWVSYAHTEFDNDFFRTKYDGDTNTFFVGADFTPKDNMVLGLAIGYEETDIDTDFNLGEADADGFTIAPYFGMTLNDTWNFDVSGGYSSIDTDQYRTSAGTRITSDVNTKRWFLAANFNGFTTIDRWNLSGRVGAMTASGEDEKFSESDGTTIAERDSEISQFNLGGEAAYAYSDEFEPFVGATYNYDMTKTETIFATGKQPSNDDDDFLLSFGFRYFAKSGLSLSAQYDTRQGRKDYDEDSLNITARWDF